MTTVSSGMVGNRKYCIHCMRFHPPWISSVRLHSSQSFKASRTLTLFTPIIRQWVSWFSPLLRTEQKAHPPVILSHAHLELLENNPSQYFTGIRSVQPISASSCTVTYVGKFQRHPKVVHFILLMPRVLSFLVGLDSHALVGLRHAPLWTFLPKFAELPDPLCARIWSAMPYVSPRAYTRRRYDVAVQYSYTG